MPSQPGRAPAHRPAHLTERPPSMPTFQICLNDTEAPYADTYADIKAACPDAVIELIGPFYRDDVFHNVTVPADQIAALADYYATDLDEFIADYQI